MLRATSEQGIQNSLSDKQQKPKWFRQNTNGPEDPPDSKEKEGECQRCTNNGDLTRSDDRTPTVPMLVSLNDVIKQLMLAKVER
jgi:hypothetical protein